MADLEQLLKMQLRHLTCFSSVFFQQMANLEQMKMQVHHLTCFSSAFFQQVAHLEQLMEMQLCLLARLEQDKKC